jgi:hypothetical protein
MRPHFFFFCLFISLSARGLFLTCRRRRRLVFARKKSLLMGEVQFWSKIEELMRYEVLF